VASSVNLSEETWSLLRRAASVFSLAYSRFKDLKKAASDLLQLKLEKQRAEEALSELKATQSQLIHAEKMASLGELTAGIAHEIQNPLNFVNNFSDLSRELLDEMMTELKTANSDEAIEIAKDVKRNVEKILHHGKRADAIVKGMLQHSRGSSGIKEPTDINELADEFLRVAFHGLRAKDASFNATFSTDLDSTIGNVNIMPQDFGRVLLNLITNAFYAVSEKKNLVGDALQPDGKPYQPSVAIITRKKGKKVEISVKDNGNGIPREIREKIFQPFFTTKPTGQGTGLGLSLSYDFIKAHGGKLEVKTQEGEGAEFVIEIPTDD
jgi:signal transduction histidine kinase